MDEKYFQCPHCGKGTLESKIIDYESNGDYSETYYYSCRHRRQSIISHAEIHNTPGPVWTKLKSCESLEKKPKYEITGRSAKDDFDAPDQVIDNRIYKNRKNVPTTVFHVVQYASGKLKHVECKTCNSIYQHSSPAKLEDLFFIDFTNRHKIECLKCHAKFEQ